MLIVLCYVEKQRQKTYPTIEDEYLDAKVISCNEKNVILIKNLWVNGGLVNGALGKFISTLDATTSNP